MVIELGNGNIDVLFVNGSGAVSTKYFYLWQNSMGESISCRCEDFSAAESKEHKPDDEKKKKLVVNIIVSSGIIKKII